MMRKNVRTALRAGPGMGIAGALMLFISETVLTFFYAEIHRNTYLFLLALYIAAGLVGGGFLSVLWVMVSGWRRKQPAEPAQKVLPVGFLFAFFYFYGFYYLNVGILQEVYYLLTNTSSGGKGIGFFLAGILVNAIWIVVSVFVFRRALRASSSGRGALVRFLKIGLLPIAALAATNVRFFVWQPPVLTTSELFSSLISFATAGIVGISISGLLQKLSTRVSVASSLLLSLALVVSMAISGPPSTASFRLPANSSLKGSGAQNRPNIIWIVMDTARRDHISLYGSPRLTTPNIDEFAKDARVFREAFSAAPWTLPSHASMFTGTFPSKHGAHFDGKRHSEPLSSANLTLAEILSGYGYETGFVAANYGYLHRFTGLSQGFGFYFDDRPIVFSLLWGNLLRSLPLEFVRDVLRINGPCLSSEINLIAFDWLRRRAGSEPLFLFINYMEPHFGGVVNLPEPYDSMFGYSSKKFKKVMADLDEQKVIHFQAQVTPKQKEMYNAQLDRKMYYMDYHIGKLLAYLKKMRIYENSMIILTSDHGDLFGEHHSFKHRTDLYNELIHVPLIIKYPGSSRKGVSDKLVQTLDVMPEVLKQAGIEIPSGVQGQPLDEVTHDIISELFEQPYNTIARSFPERYLRNLKAIISPSDSAMFKFIYSSSGNSELFDLKNDPRELNNIIASYRSRAVGFEQALLAWEKSFQPVKASDREEETIPAELERRLRSLGYIK